jgi:hypothetical protein
VSEPAAHCPACADEARPLRALEVDPESGLARCRAEDGGIEEVEVTLTPGAATGDLLLVHAGVAIARLGGGGESR